jgi:predicted phage baseplate assembly protein
MPLDVQEPIFDRSSEELFKELRSRIPRYNPAWTNFNDSDPGITLVQLFAWLAEMMLHRMGQVPRKNYLKFAQLLGLELRSAKPATVRLSFEPKANERPATIKERARYSATVETVKALDVIGAQLTVKAVAADGTVVKVGAPSGSPPVPFYPLGPNPEIGNALYLGFKPNPRNPFPFPGKMTFLVLRPAEETVGAAQKIGEQIQDLIAPVDLVWEYRPKKAQAIWERLNVFLDQTVALTRDGYIEVEGPRSIEASHELGALVKEDFYWLRLRLDQRSYPSGRAPRLEFLLPNSVDAENLVTEGAPNQVLGISSGRGDQYFDLPRRPIDPKSLQIVVRARGVDEPWERRDDLYGSKRDSKHFVLNATSGRITFGDGERGMIPTAGSEIVALLYRYGGGAVGNRVMAGGVNTMVTQVAGIERVTNVRAATGGSDEETVEEFLKVAPNQMRHRGRAVTMEDFVSLALEIDGVKQARAIGGRHPDFPDVEVPGAITVVIVADSDAKPPKPTSELIRSVCKRLENVRLITTEVYVAAPSFLEIRIEARLIAAPEAAFDEVARKARERLDKLLDARTWPFGKNLSVAEIYRELLDDEEKQVRSVEDLFVYVDGRSHDVSGPVPVPDDSVVYPGGHLIVVQPDRDVRASA